MLFTNAGSLGHPRCCCCCGEGGLWSCHPLGWWELGMHLRLWHGRWLCLWTWEIQGCRKLGFTPRTAACSKALGFFPPPGRFLTSAVWCSPVTAVLLPGLMVTVPDGVLHFPLAQCVVSTSHLPDVTRPRDGAESCASWGFMGEGCWNQPASVQNQAMDLFYFDHMQITSYSRFFYCWWWSKYLIMANL